LGSKPAALLAGRPLMAYSAEALAQVCERVAVVCKRSSEVPSLAGVERWDEPDQPRHPLTGIVNALETAGAPVLVCAADMPFVTAEACRSLLTVAARAGAVATVAIAGDVLQPVLAVYAPVALDVLRSAAGDEPLARTVERLDPVRVALPAPLLRSVNTAEDLAAAETSVRGA